MSSIYTDSNGKAILYNGYALKVYSQPTPPVTPTSAQYFTFSGNTLTGYNGTDMDIVIPRSYSVGPIVPITHSYSSLSEMQNDLGYYYFENDSNYPMTITANGQDYTLYSVSDYWEYEYVFEEANSLQIVIDMQTYIDGEDYQVTTIAGYAFRYSSIISVTILDNITTLQTFAFLDCPQLETIYIPDTVINIGQQIFGNCESLENISLPSNMTAIPNGGMFQGCISLQNIDFLPSTITTIGSSAFHGCTGLTNINIPYGVTTLGGSIFRFCTGLTNLTIPSSVTTIASDSNSWSLTEGCFNLREFNSTSSSVTTANNNTLLLYGTNLVSAALYNMTSCIIPEGVTNILGMMFRNCTTLTELVFPSTTTYIGNDAIYGCTGLTELTVLATTPPELYSGYGFPNTITTIYVPNGCKEAYEYASGWSNLTSQVTFVELS